jgi:hypothetical protein
MVIWDYELTNIELVRAKIQNAIDPPVFDFRQCVVKPAIWDESKDLLDKWHYQRAGRSGYCVGVFLLDRLVATMVFAHPIRQEIASKQQVEFAEILELSRVVIDPIYQSRNFATWMLARGVCLISKLHPQIKMLVSFADPTFGHDGTIYRASNWKYDGESPASYWYYHRRHNKIIHKKTIWDAAKKLSLTEAEYAQMKHYIKVCGQPKLRFLYIFRH